ncbi:MAG: type II toxin-antitoxin system RelE/ParE family toxin [Okeania sp. SIO2F4]|uniref:type II toxin-antitoxin system RelE/ParE family toxin n=1 Tax=Okeania sp. SIO2F4 TaxID=2607790 RepID=UPI001429482B|nr:type II toxin-antitoxin system RelE/ParE family toxin [Okeania sp. SIO2F4]MDJ0519512.1 type II toxin-antitoxin system RelE/ParE family toxin [Trichodesmium sp. MO_231.B1]NES05606.1 type II toxin-antitoxin system RelE/ParE family toxin [Okeania sp. SIO2F4]
MTRQIVIRPKASDDLDEQFAYIAKDNMDAALRFFDATRETISQLAKMPGIGSPVQNSSLAGLRKLAVKGFNKHLIFYLTQDNYIDVVRILHAARDLPTIIDSEE